MTVSSSTNRVNYNGDDSTTVFAYSFKVFDQDDLTVILRSSNGTETVQTITTDYTVSGVGDAGGGNVTMVTAPATGEQLTILREQPLTQGLDLVPNDPFPANSIEESLDKITFMVQKHEEELGRAIKASRTNTISGAEFTVSASDRANKVFAFDSSGDLAVTQELGTFRGDWAVSTAYSVRDLVKDTSTNNIFIVNSAHTSSGSQPLTTNANSAKYDLIVDAASATTSATNAATSAAAALASETAAAASETAAATSESNASTSASNASTSETNAATSATNAATSESNAAGSESAAATSATNAATSETNAATSQSAAATSATTATTQATAAATSATNAATSATTATTQATAAATSATNAATSETNAGTSETNAATSATAAAASAAAAAASADTFDDTYLGSKSSDPTVDNDGDALNAGDLYFNTTSNTLKVYSGSAWQDAAVDASGFITTSGGTLTGNLNYGDSVKAQFGASNDLQIYHDGAHSYLHETGTGELRLKSNGNAIQFLDNSNNYLIRADIGSSVGLYHNTAEKLTTTSTGVDVTGEMIADSYNETYAAVTSSSNATTVDCHNGNAFSHTLTENTTFTFSNPPASGTAFTFSLEIIQDASASGYTVTWPSSVDWPSATAPTLTATASAKDVFVFYTRDGGTTWYGFTAGQALG